MDATALSLYVICENFTLDLRLIDCVQEAKQSVIELKEDDPDAMKEVLRTIYGSPESHALSRPWRYWLNVTLTADKYFELGLGETAQKNLQKVSNARDVDEVLDIIQAIQRELQHLSSMLTFASDLRKKNILGLHKNARYRDLLFKDRELVGSHFDELSQIMVPKTWLCKSCTNETGIDPFSMR